MADIHHNQHQGPGTNWWTIKNFAESAHAGAAAKDPKDKERPPKTVIDFSFSCKGSHSQIVMVMSDGIDSRIVVFDYINFRVEAVHDFNKTIIDKVTFNPVDDNIICVSGVNIWCCFRIHEGGLRDNQAFNKVETS